jgi:hypothetical protein
MVKTTTKAALSDVDQFLAALDHPAKPVIETLRGAIRQLDPRISESIKWNAPSFALREHFATFRIAPKGEVQLIFHLGAKPQPDATLRATIADPDRVLQWKSADRAVADLSNATVPQLLALLKQWVDFLNRADNSGAAA